ncbi:protein kinase [Trypanosoma theileri]|uniref:Serine/threonine-protein kinase PLK n=1 Tax=Trypanosoma theileri TaxID=67003 RepID=A0A1X0NTN5_9TRYP|nr:protein kinase [Trypanosoma theileri]ORC87833.1 protein kinase [Trypanosoma theileri]
MIGTQPQPPVMPAQRYGTSRMGFPSTPRSERPDFREGSSLREYDRHGRIVGTFRCGRLLGRGGFAKCYDVERDGESYALKVIDRAILQKTKTLQKLHSEISIHRRMKHKNIVNFIRTFQDDWNVYILLEKCSNQTLMEISKRRARFTVPETQYIMLQSLAAIQYMHDQSVIHRDLKLGNMMMDADMNVKIGDFGLAAELQYEGERKRTICGTPNYIAPEIIDGAHEGHSYEVDIWSLGVILYTLLVGEPPFQTSDVKATYRRIKQCRYEFPPRVDIPDSGKELIHRILQSRPDHRPTLIEIRSHPFFRSPVPPLTAPLSLFPTSARHRMQGSSEQQQEQQQQQQKEQELQQQKLQKLRGMEMVGCTPVTTVPPARREVLRPLSANTIGSTRQPVQSESPQQMALHTGVPSNSNKNYYYPQRTNNNNINGPSTVTPTPRAETARQQGRTQPQVSPPTPPPPPPQQQQMSSQPVEENEENAAATRVPHYQLDEEEKNQLTALHDHLHQTLLEVAEPRVRETQPPLYAAGIAAEEDEDSPSAFPLPSVWVTDFADFSAKYGLCYRLSTGHTGVHFNDSTKMVWEPITGRVEYYARVKEVVTRSNNNNVVHARDQLQSFHMESFPESLNKKVTLIKYFKSYLSRARSVREGVEVVRCSPYMNHTPSLLSDPHMIEDIVYVKRWLLTPQAMIFRLSNKTIQVCFHDKAEVILSSESRVVTYTDAAGHRVTMSLASVASRSKEVAARLRYTKDILCELIQNREL